MFRHQRGAIITHVAAGSLAITVAAGSIAGLTTASDNISDQARHDLIKKDLPLVLTSYFFSNPQGYRGLEGETGVERLVGMGVNDFGWSLEPPEVTPHGTQLKVTFRVPFGSAGHAAQTQNDLKGNRRDMISSTAIDGTDLLITFGKP